MALLSFLSDTWQSVQVFVSVVLTVCAKCGAKACEEKPLDDMGGC